MAKYYRNKENVIFDIVVVSLVVLVLIVCLVPFMYVLSASFSGPKPLTNGEVFLFPKDFTLNAYVKIFQYPNFLRSYGNTILYTVLGTAVCLVMTILMAFPLAHSRLKGHGFFMKLVVITMFFSGGLIPKFLLVNSLKLTDTVWAIVLPNAINTFNLIVLINFFKTIPRELEEAALIDGMGYFNIMRNIFLPLSIPALATITLYYAVYFWNDWFNALIYVKSDKYPVMMILRNLVMGTTQMDVGSIGSEGDTVSIAMKCAVIVTSSVPIIVLYPFLSKYFVKGLTIGGVKG
ncbi:MAG: carbohydrate ABC transporter permease [Oscillospiraceae bacterium]|nr:carbohydrate ABC transporter permease [Oscillospiraceae bacterium]